MRPVAQLLAALPALASLACAAPQRRVIGAPDTIGRPSIAHFSPSDAFGHQIIVTTSTTRMFAELVACDEGFVYLHTNDAGPHAWTMVPWQLVERAEVPTPGSARVTNIVMLTVGSVAAATHGIWASITVPLWATAGVPSIFWAIADERVAGRCQELDPYTRYPQGMPLAIHEQYWGKPSMAPLPVAPLLVAPGPAAPVAPAPAAPPPGPPVFPPGVAMPAPP